MLVAEKLSGTEAPALPSTKLKAELLAGEAGVIVGGGALTTTLISALARSATAQGRNTS